VRQKQKKKTKQNKTKPIYTFLKKTVIMTVFAVTGSSTAFVVRPLVSDGLGLQGSFKDGPMSFRVVSLVAMMPIYSALLVTVGTIFGRHTFFKRFAVKMWSRLLPASVKAKLLK
jgi:hypothetical protein